VPYKGNSNEERDAAVERLREFLRFNYVTGTQVARQMGVRDTTLYSWLQGNSKPRSAERITAFLDSIPADSEGTSGHEYREYKNWRGIPKPRRCPFCKRAKGEIRKAIESLVKAKHRRRERASLSCYATDLLGLFAHPICATIIDNFVRLYALGFCCNNSSERKMKPARGFRH
jgi:hypothetical protein